VGGSRRRALRIGIGLTAVLLAVGGLALGLGGLRISRAEVKAESDDNAARQVTVFAIVATPGSKTVDSRLVSIKTQLDKLLPHHVFRLLHVQSKRIVAGDSVACDLGNGYKAETFLVRSADDNGKIHLRCELFEDQSRLSSTLVKSPLNQLFFCQRGLPDKSQLLIGVGAR
jgi:hypothetical protein